mgnify:CR=1 FL=1
MAVTVKIPTPLRGLTGDQDTYQAPPSDLRGVVTSLEGAFPGMQERLLDDGGELRRFVNIYVNGEDVRARVIGEGANLGCTQAGRIEFALTGGRINTDFIDNSAGVDCSDNEVNIKIALNREMMEGRLSFEDRNVLLGSMTEDVAHLVLEDNRLQTLSLSIAEGDGALALPSYVRVIEIFEAAGRLDRQVEGLGSNVDLMRRVSEGRGLTRPELAVLLATAKLSLQDAIEGSGIGSDAVLEADLHAAFPAAMRDRFFYDADGELIIVPQLGVGGWMALEGKIEVGTVVAIVSGIAILHEPLSLLQAIAIASTVISLWLALVPGKPAPARQSG